MKYTGNFLKNLNKKLYYKHIIITNVIILLINLDTYNLIMKFLSYK